MSNDMAEEWLTVAVRELHDADPDAVVHVAETVRRTCTHHGQIIPLMIAELEKCRLERSTRLSQEADLRAPVYLPKPPQWHPTIEELDEIKRAAADALRAKP